MVKKSDFIEFLLGSVMTFLTLVVVIYEYKIEACGMFVVKTRDETQACNKQSSRSPIQSPSVGKFLS